MNEKELLNINTKKYVDYLKIFLTKEANIIANPKAKISNNTAKIAKLNF
ncbi:MAG: hypothetical protein ACRC7B_02345 [Metamycoplasmataceae bacterium]